MFIIGTTYYNLSLCTDATTRFQDWREAINGGTGSDMDKIDAAIHEAAYPTQTSHAGEFLTTNGSAVSWADLPSEIYLCEYDVEPYADVAAAYESGKTLIAYQEVSMGINTIKRCYALYQAVHNGTGYTFYFTNVNSSNVRVVTLDYFGVWDIDSFAIQLALPSQTSQSGKFLTTDGTGMSWADVPTELPSQTGNGGKYLTTNGSAPSWGTVDSSPVISSTNLVSSGGVYTAIDNKVNRTTAVNVADAGLTTLMARGEKLLDKTTYDAVTSWSSHLVDGAIVWRYE